MIKYKTYIGAVEAFELAMGWGIEKLPHKGQQILHVPSIKEIKDSGIHEQVLSKDEWGFYIENMEVVK